MREKFVIEDGGETKNHGWCSNQRAVICVLAVFCLCALLTPIIYFSVVYSNNNGDTSEVVPPIIHEKPSYSGHRMNCIPESENGKVVVTASMCESRGCVYDHYAEGDDVKCFHNEKNFGYKIWSREDNDHGFNLELHQFGKAPFGGEIATVYFIVDYVTDTLLHFRFDGGHHRYHVPLDLNLPQNGANNPKYRVDVHDNQEMFSFSVVRKDTGTSIWNTSLAGFVFSKQFLQISTILPSSNIYGFGENRHKSFRHVMNQTWPMFSRDQAPGQVDNSNLYGVHPFYECVEDKNGNTHGVFLLNSNAQEYSFTDLPSLTYRTIGGILDFYLFMGPTPENVIQQYTNLIGLPMMPPYWSLGFQLCRYGYNHIDNLTRAVENTKKHNIPLDVQYADIDHMDERMVFTIDNVNFPGLNDYFKSLHENGMRTIIILDPTLISNVTGYEPYEKMKAIDGNIKWPTELEIPDSDQDENRAVLGYVWPKGKVAFPDFMKKETGDVWKELIKKHHKEQLVFDGLWIDMNEPANFGTNEEKPWNWPEKDKPYWSLQCDNNTWDDPPYRTKVGYVYDQDNKITRISEKTICMISRLGPGDKYKHYDVHSLYGLSQTKPTLQGLQEATGKRGIVISRSTFPSSGKYSGHWLGDNDSNWSSMVESIIGILEFNLFGIPYIGADICGFFGDTTPELCKRWMQLGAFYTFSRNHNGNGYTPQDPGALGEDVAKASREALETRYWLLPYLYTLFHHAHKDGNTVIRPLHHEFPADENTYDIDRQFLWGSALLISPILEPNQTRIKFYLPDSTWYDFYTGRKISENGFVTEIVHPDSKIPLHVQGGHILELQKPSNNTSFSRKNGFRLVVALKEGEASGELYWDDGDSMDAFENGLYYLAKFKAVKNYLTMSVEHNNVPEIKEEFIEKIEIWGLNSVTDNVILFNADNTMTVLQPNYDSISKVTSVENLNIPLEHAFHLSWREIPTEQFSRIDCFPQRLGGYIKLTEQACRERNCEYDEDIFHPEVPVCYFKNGGYRVTALTVKTDLGFQIPLTRIGPGPFQDNKQKLLFTVEMHSDSLIRFKFDAVGENRYTVPKEMNTPNGTVTNEVLYEFKVTNNDTFAFQIIRKETGTVIFDTGVGGMVFAEQFLQISTKLPSTSIYGFGENLHHSFRHDLSFETWSMFSRDQPTVESYGNHLNHYGVHPFYVGMEDDGKAHGVLLLNSNAQDYSFTPLPMLTYRTIGGILDFYIFMGPSPENVIQQYTKVIGRPMMPPYWSLGFQLCRYGYDSLDNLKAAVARIKASDIPHDVQYADIDHYDNNKIFTVDQQRFGGLSDYFNELRAEGMSTIIILDPCIVSNETNYQPYDDIRQISGSIMWPDNFSIPDGSADTDRAMFGYVWPQGKVVFPDYFKTETSNLWKKWIKDYHKKLVFDGLWIDMNEPANFGTNEERAWNWPVEDKPYWSLKCPTNKWDDPEYRTRAGYSYDYGYKAARLSDKTLCLVGRQGDQGQYSHYDVHSLYGWSQTMPTFQGLQEATGERGIVVTRSTFVGSGQYSGHWLGDNKSTWEDLRLSIIGMLEFNLFGIPYIGADICGYFEDTNVELCKRWMQLGAFYPYSRNHNGKGYIDQDPGALGEEVVVASREALRTRYQLLPYLYTLFHQAHVDGNTVVRPLHHEFPDEKTTYGIQEQFMWGRSLLISPILYPLQTTLKMYKPNGVWYDWYSRTAVSGPTTSLYKILDITSDSRIPLHIRAGSILCLQDYARNTRESRKKPMRLLVALDVNNNNVINGELFWDDGVSIDTYENGNYHKAEFEFKEATLSMKILHSAIEEVNHLYIETIEFMGFPQENVIVRYESENMDLPFTYDKEKQILVINHTFPLTKEFTLVFANLYSSHLVTKEHYSRINCYPEAMGRIEMVNQSNCQARGCLYDSAVMPGIPHCFYKTTNYGYMINGSKIDTDLGYQIPLKRSSLPGPFPKDLDEITFEVQELDDHLLRVKIFDKNQKRFEVPLKLAKPDTRAVNPRYMVKYINNDTFSFQIIRQSTGTVLFDTSVGGLTFADQFLQISTMLPSTNIYGFGENVKDSFRHNLWFKSYPMFSRDQPTNVNGPYNHYGVHPFYTVLENDGNSHGVFILNSNAQEYSFTPLPMLTYRTIGGILDLYFFLGPEPENVIQQYTTMIGKPYMPPYWSLGFQLSRFGYDNLDEMKQAVDRTREAEIPHDVQMVDIDHMDQRKDFTVDDVNFAGLKDYFNELRNGGMRTIIVLDPALLAEETNYEPYERIKAVNGYIKWPVGASIPPNSSTSDRSLLGRVWPPGKVVFPDFFNENTTRVWSELIAEHLNLVPFDGIWIDMNEPANFETNNEDSNWTLKCTNNEWDDPPYRTMAAFVYDESRNGGVNKTGRLSDKTICMNTVQGVDEQYRHYDVHSLYGWSQTSATLQGIRQGNNNQGRGLVLSRSTFPGSGASSVHWLGDNESTWKQMKQSITGLLDFNLFGIPFIGADMCGYFGDTTPELCKRWMQLGAFYTFSRDHNEAKTKAQDPGALGEDVAKASREALETRYWLLPYLYTLFHHAHKDGNTVIRPLHHEYPTDSNTYGIKTQFLWGPALLISPILYQDQKSISYYLPGGRWYDFYTGEKVTNGKEYKNVKVTGDSKIPLHVRGGYILPLQEPANNTRFSRENPFKLLVAMEDIPGRGLYASGKLFWDDGDSIDTYENGMYLSMYFECFKNRLDIRVQYDNMTGNDLMVDSIEILGVENWVNYVQVNGIEHNRFTNHQSYKKLLIRNLGLKLKQNTVIEWSQKREGTQEEYDRIDCLPDADKYTDVRTECTRRNCIWKPVNDVDGLPACFIDNSRYGYNLISTSTSGTETFYHLQWRNQSQMFTGDLFNITLVTDYINDKLIRFKLFDPSSSRYEVPVNLNLEPTPVNNPTYQFKYELDKLNRFSFKINRRSTNKTIFDTSIGGLTFADQFLQLVTRVPSKDLYGFGENRHFSLRHDFNYKRWPMFSRDQAPGWGDYGNLYGVHPFYTCIEDDQGNTHGVLLLNSNAMEIGLQPSPAITYRTIGGVLDFYMFLGPEPESVIQQYTNMIGRPYLPPYWSLGFQLCRYGYNSLKTMREAVDRTIAADIPFDVQYADIDHMDERMDFTIDETNFDGLSEFVRDLQDRGMRFIIILDPAIISNVTNYRPYELGLEKDIYIKWPTGMNPDNADDNLLGYVWPKGKTVFPDFLNSNSSSYWSELIVDHFKEIPYDGLWIDMNEPANFGTNEERPWNWPVEDKPYWSLECPTNKWDDPPYKPKSVYGPRLSEKTVCMVSLQNNGVYRHYDVHSLYGWSQTEPTLRALQTASGKRGMVISRSTYPGSGQYSGHWLGDNDSSWKHLYDSIIGIIEFNLFGIPYIGADICGFFGDSSPELCERWMQLGAFYTYNRNHNGLNNKPQDPAAFGLEVTVSSRKALRIRYSLLPYLYTLFFNVNQRGGTVIRGLFHEFPADEVARKIETQFVWGSSFMVAPVYLPGVSRREVYFPGRATIWYDYYTGKEIRTREGYETVPAPRDTIPLFVRGGSILPTQHPANTTMFSRLNPFKLIVAPDDSSMASGTLFWDDGEGIGTVENGQYFTAEFTSMATSVSMAVTKQHNVVNDLEIHSITIFNIPSKPSGTELILNGGNSRNTDIQYNSFHKVLKLSGFKIPLSNNFTLSWILPP